MKPAILGCFLVLASLTSGSAQGSDAERQSPDVETPEEQAPEKEEEADPESRRVYWDDGLWVRGWSGKMRMMIGGQAQNDTAGFVADGTQPVEIENGVEWRRARVYALGTIGKRWGFKFQWDLADRPYLKDAWLQWRLLIFDGKVWLRAGRFTTTFGLENDGSSNDLLFMEQGLPSAFVPPQETGVLLHSESTNRRWDVSFSSSADELECLLCNVVGISARYSTHFDFGREDRLLHVGANYSRRWTSDETVNYAQRPESHIAPLFVDTGPVTAKSVDSGFVEAAFIQGPFSVQGEAAVAAVKPPEGRRPVFYGFYVSGAYSLTGEMRPYRRRLGTIGRIEPKRSWREGGRGAFEIALRFSRIDLNDGAVGGGALNDWSFALNWYPNLPGKVSFNVIRAAREGWDPVWVFQSRLQWAY
jgi:phosphate-selective porin OprO/OprP